MQYGAEKYGEDNWRLGKEPKDIDRYLSAALRHIKAHEQEGYRDKDSGLPHLAHAITNLLFISKLQKED